MQPSSFFRQDLSLDVTSAASKSPSAMTTTPSPQSVEALAGRTPMQMPPRGTSIQVK